MPNATCNWHPLPGRRLPARVEAATGMGEQKVNVPFASLAYVRSLLYVPILLSVRAHCQYQWHAAHPREFSRSYIAATRPFYNHTLRTLRERQYHWRRVGGVVYTRV